MQQQVTTPNPQSEPATTRLPAPGLRAGAGPLAVAACVFWIAYDGGSFDVTSWTAAAIAVWWSVGIALALGTWPLARPPRTAIAIAGLLLAFAGLSGASMAWGASGENAFTALDRGLLYSGVFALAVLGSHRSNLTQWSDGLAIGLAAVCLLALASRFFPGLVHGNPFAALPVGAQRLNWPVGYWNGLAVVGAMATLLLIRPAIAARTGTLRGLAVAPIPAIVVMLFLTSSRTGAGTAALGLLALVVLTPRRTAVVLTLVVVAAGSAAALAVTLPRHAIVDGPFTTAVAMREGHSAAYFVAAVCIVTGVAHGVFSDIAQRRLRLPHSSDRVVLAAIALLLAAGVAAAHPIRAFDNFRSAPPVSTQNPQFVQQHLLSTSGNGRWPLWTAALHEFRDHVWLGGGAGSFESFWNRTRSTTLVVRDPHSLYLQALAELGALGALLIVAAIVGGVAVGVVRIRPTTGGRRLALSGLVSTALTFAIAVGTDWMWQLPIVSIVGTISLGLVVGPATLRTFAGRRMPSRRRMLPVIAAVLALCVAIIALEAIPLLANEKLRESQKASAVGKTRSALADAVAARNLEPWAASPYLQLALLSERSGRIGDARGWLQDAIARDPQDWSLFVVAARLETKQGRVAAARESLATARALNPLAVAQLPK